MAKNKNKKPQQEGTRGWAEGPGRVGRGRGRGGRGGRGGANDGGGDTSPHGQGGSRGDGPSRPNFRGGPPPPTLDRGFPRGRGGRGRGRGGWTGRGRGSGGVDLGGFTGNIRGGMPVNHPMDEIDFEIQQWNESPQSGRNTPGGRGRGSPSKSSGNNTPRGRGGRGGRGVITPGLPSGSSLSSLWYEERPLLRPIKFVRSIETATLFQEAEELLEPTAQNPDETAESHVPTADKVSRVFSSTHPHLFDNSLFNIEEGIEEVNFEDLALVHERVLNSAPSIITPPAVQTGPFTGVSRKPAPKPEVPHKGALNGTLVATDVTGTTLGFSTTDGAELHGGHTIKSTTKAARAAPSVLGEPMIVEREIMVTTADPEPTTILTGPSPLFFIDTDPSASQTQIPIPAYSIHPHTESLGGNAKAEVEPDSEDDVIVYDAPNPRISTPRVELSTLANISLLDHTTSSTPRQVNPLRRGKFVHVVGRNVRRGSGGVLGVKRKKLSEHKNFAAFGAMIAEARLRMQDEEEDKDPKEHLRRQGDSDLDWGDETDESEKENCPVIGTAEGMDLDPELVGAGVTMAAMESFVQGVNGNHARIDDLEDAIAQGDLSSDGEMDEDEDGDGSDSEDLEGHEEMMLIEEFIADQYGSDFSDDDDDELDPRAGFQARLDRLREKQLKVIKMEDYDDDDDDEMDPELQWDEGEEIDDFVAGALDKYEKNRAAHNAVFKAIQDGFFDDPQPKASSSKRKDLPAELQAQWEKDKLKKAGRRKERELARIEAVLNPLVTKKGGKKSRKAMIAAAKLDPSIEIPHRTIDMVSIEQQIRRFLADKDKRNLVLPVCDKDTRWKIHSLAPLFGLKSKSKGPGERRYTTLFKDEQSGKYIDERKVARLMKGFNYRASYDVWDDMKEWKGKGKDKGKGKGKGKKERGESGDMKTREGDVVGHAAPKIDETNIGFMMLASMGWSDGATIGLSGGLDVPLTAVIKKTKLGLGASLSTKP
ncbi:hypothetical protein BJ322DRAFT_1029752 [Thelephora terrestris]|uniref:Protein SQS1 n=1 Tax=Thelephora terrestris TaxID=56493 RepID=A0A9P6LCP9_9AGAM|nr:hypothetical protein BJ322DRAFT_1029752 [Thelephora terrestris]